MFGSPRQILIVSPQPWEGLKVSKHHYAAELAALGHRVTFVGPPNLHGRPGTISITDTDAARVQQLVYSPLLPYELKFHARSCFDWGMRMQARRIAARIGGPPDIVWDFDNSYQFADLRAFRSPIRIFHPVDSPAEGRASAKGANLVLSVSQVFLDRLAPVQGHVVPHALSASHLAHAEAVLRSPARPIRARRSVMVGYAGNLEHVGIDWPAMVAMVRQNPSVQFRFIGPYSETSDGRVPLAQLRAVKNVELPGLQPAQELLARAAEIDIWLVCYDAAKTVDGAINSHKILEYLATGSPVVSNRIAAYVGSDLVEMPDGPSNEAMPELLRRVIARRTSLDSPVQRQRRAAFASQFSYSGNLRTIDELARAAIKSSRTLAGVSR